MSSKKSIKPKKKVKTKEATSVNDPKESPYFLEVWTDKPQSIRGLLEAIKDFRDECNIHFDEKGMKIKTIDGSHSALVHVRLDNKKFNKYYIYNNLSIGINIGSVHKLLKNVDASDVLKLYVTKKNQNVLTIRIENSIKNNVFTFEYKLLDIDEDEIHIPEVEFNSIITMPSVDLNNHCRLMSTIGNEVDIKSAGNELYITCNGDTTNMNAQLGSNGSDIDVATDEDGEIVQGRYLLKFLSMFTKAYNLSGTVEILMKNDFPLILKYDIADLGVIKYCLAPIHKDT